MQKTVVKKKFDQIKNSIEKMVLKIQHQYTVYQVPLKLEVN